MEGFHICKPTDPVAGWDPGYTVSWYGAEDLFEHAGYKVYVLTQTLQHGNNCADENHR